MSVLNTSKIVEPLVKNKEKDNLDPPDPYRVYNQTFNISDREFTRACNESMDTMLVFAGLFSAVLATFIQESRPMLEESAEDRTNQLLEALITKQNDIPVSNFTVPTHALVINLLFFISLLFSLTAGLCAMLVKEWVRQIESGLDIEAVLWRRAHKHSERRHSFSRWHLSQIIGWVPMLLHVALFLFLPGVVYWLHLLHKTLLITTSALLSFITAVYFGVACIPSFEPNAPFQWPLSITIMKAAGLFRRRRRHEEAETDVEMPPLDIRPDVAPQNYALTPLIPSNQHSVAIAEQSRPAQLGLNDARILIRVIEWTSAHAELDAAMKLLQEVNISDNRLSSLLFEHAHIIQQRCSQLSDSCWMPSGSAEKLVRPGFLNRSRRLCRFIEWFYYQLSPEQISLLPNWPALGVVEALDASGVDMDVISDRILAISVLSKWHHINQKPQDRCQFCFQSKTFREIREYLRINDFGNEPATWNLDDWFYIHELVTAILSCDMDCLLHYASFSSTADMKLMENVFINDFGLIGRRARAVSKKHLMPQATRILNHAKLSLSDKDPRAEFVGKLHKIMMDARESERTGNEKLDFLTPRRLEEGRYV